MLEKNRGPNKNNDDTEQLAHEELHKDIAGEIDGGEKEHPEKKIMILENLDVIRKKTKRGCVFLDRDGVIIKDTNYISRPKDVEIVPGIIEFLRKCRQLGYAVIVVTNQSGIGRGYFSWEDYEDVTEEMLSEVNSEKAIDAIYANSELPGAERNEGSWRKPNNGMLTDAIQRFEINMSRSTMVGDRMTDMLAGYRAGCKKLILVANENDEHKDESNEDNMEIRKSIKTMQSLWNIDP